MVELKGKCNSAKVFIDSIDSETTSQVVELLNQDFIKESKIRIMPDCHAGAGCVIGTTMTLKDKVVPNLVGVDIGCGMLTVELEEMEKDIDLYKLDRVISRYIPSGFNVHDELVNPTLLNCTKLRCWGKTNIDDSLAYRSVGTLGGGNHFIELDKDDSGKIYLVVHTGSRHLGLEVAGYYQRLAWSRIRYIRDDEEFIEKKEELVERLMLERRHSEIGSAIAELREEYLESKRDRCVSKDLAYVEGSDFDDYIHDMKMVQEHAMCNRMAIARTIIKEMGFTEVDRFETIHNYIDTDNMILRKGAVSARDGERLLIPMNMRDGSLICRGKGNPDWNYSAPHGAGRLFSRFKARGMISMEEFVESMKGIYTTCVCEGTLDESPMAYKSMEEIVNNIDETVDIVKVIKPIYNFKAR